MYMYKMSVQTNRLGQKACAGLCYGPRLVWFLERTDLKTYIWSESVIDLSYQKTLLIDEISKKLSEMLMNFVLHYLRPKRGCGNLYCCCVLSKYPQVFIKFQNVRGSFLRFICFIWFYDLSFLEFRFCLSKFPLLPFIFQILCWSSVGLLLSGRRSNLQSTLQVLAYSKYM